MKYYSNEIIIKFTEHEKHFKNIFYVNLKCGDNFLLKPKALYI